MTIPVLGKLNIFFVSGNIKKEYVNLFREKLYIFNSLIKIILQTMCVYIQVALLTATITISYY